MSSKIKKTNIIIFCYNRPKHIKKLILNLNKIKNRKIYVVCDGPKSKSDKNFVNKVRKIINNSNLNISKKIYFESNIGVRNIFKIGLDWVFRFEKQIIILEDDILASKSFFSFCDKLLIKYKNKKKISQIAGCNINEKITKNYNDSYFYSRYSNIWGWATWKDRWISYDNNFTKLKYLLNSKSFIKNCKSKKEYSFWKKYFSIHFNNKEVGTWDYAWTYTNFLKNRASIVPKNNLIQNIGFDIGTGKNPKKLSNLKKKNINLKLKYPKTIYTDIKYDNYCSAKVYSIPSLEWRIKKKILNIFELINIK